MSEKMQQNIRKVLGTSNRPRVSVFRSNKSISAEVIDDTRGVTLFSLSSSTIKDGKKPVEKALEIGRQLAKIAKTKKVDQLVYDRRSYRYHGQVKALAEGLREGGIKI